MWSTAASAWWSTSAACTRSMCSCGRRPGHRTALRELRPATATHCCIGPAMALLTGPSRTSMPANCGSSNGCCEMSSQGGEPGEDLRGEPDLRLNPQRLAVLHDTVDHVLGDRDHLVAGHEAAGFAYLGH